ncbi:Flap endonuclease GEN 1 [Araneus ventricosus]|uniref:Flap endonuclease GEN 1 n=1 Tax=Araneus ventricosus TaxID=182803 RepID=A0A4Y2GUY3_ARAVE|nr:Flap endonuclease GEN 1 [Araneus ventricosus]
MSLHGKRAASSFRGDFEAFVNLLQACTLVMTNLLKGSFLETFAKMGVTGLWSILSELCERKDIKYLCGKRVAVDLSGWVVQAIQCKGLSAVKNPHLRNLFFRVSGLLLNGVHPVFVLEGKVPDLKQAAFKKRNYQGNNNSDNVSRPLFDRILNQCHELLKSLGVPCIKSSGEAEAFCAFLCAKGIVDGVITNDNDAFLYGADTVYRDFSIDPKVGVKHPPAVVVWKFGEGVAARVSSSSSGCSSKF